MDAVENRTLSLNEMIDALGSPDLQKRLRAEYALLCAEQEGVEPLIDVLAERSRPDEARWRAAVVLGYSGAAAAVPALIDALDDTSGDVRHSAVWALARLRDAAAFDRLAAIALSGVKDEQIPLVAAIGLVLIDHERGRDVLDAASRSENDIISSIAASALAGFRFR